MQASPASQLILDVANLPAGTDTTGLFLAIDDSDPRIHNLTWWVPLTLPPGRYVARLTFEGDTLYAPIRVVAPQ